MQKIHLHRDRLEERKHLEEVKKEKKQEVEKEMLIEREVMKGLLEEVRHSPESKAVIGKLIGLGVVQPPTKPSKLDE